MLAGMTSQFFTTSAHTLGFQIPCTRSVLGRVVSGRLGVFNTGAVMPSRIVTPRLTAELELWQRGLRVVAGVDEVGMGPLAGPVVAAAVIFSSTYETNEFLQVFPQGVRDSKALTAKARERLDREIRQV